MIIAMMIIIMFQRCKLFVLTLSRSRRLQWTVSRSPQSLTQNSCMNIAPGATQLDPTPSNHSYLIQNGFVKRNNLLNTHTHTTELISCNVYSVYWFWFLGVGVSLCGHWNMFLNVPFQMLSSSCAGGSVDCSINLQYSRMFPVNRAIRTELHSLRLLSTVW